MSTPQKLTRINPPHTDLDKLRVAKLEHEYCIKETRLYSRDTLKKILEVVTAYKAGQYNNGQPPTLEIPDIVDKDERPYTLTLDLGYHGED
ncbi:hypothetical protein DPV78_007046 [Talaromyces pinophilus]|nr:hypothetical protein DPV78_007046 [Talaromyces pinophilus]